MKQKTPNTILVVLTCIVLLTGVWLLGKRQGAREALADVSVQMSSAEAQSMIDQLQLSLRDKEQEVVVLSQDVQAREARAQALLEQLDKQMRDNTTSASDLALYRKIETTERPRSIEVESIIWRASENSTLEVVMIQWQGRNRVSGELRVSLGYLANKAQAGLSDVASNSDGNEKAESNQAAVGTTSTDAGAARTTLSDNLRVDIEAQTFDFRFFQKLKVPMPLPISNLETGNSHLPVPDYVEVVLTPSDTRVKSVKTQIPWKEIAE